MSTDRPMTYEEFFRRRIREILEDRPITPNPFVVGVELRDGKLVFQVERPPDLSRPRPEEQPKDGGEGEDR